jgi:hypothetical protein
MSKYPTPVYFGHTSGYKLHVYHGPTQYDLALPELQKLRADVLDLIHMIHAVLTPHQATKCLKEDCAVVFLNHSEFLQQCTLSANPLFLSRRLDSCEAHVTFMILW